MKLNEITERIWFLIGKNQLKTAIKEMNHLLKNSSKLDEVILQSGRLSDLMRKIRMGIITDEDADVNKNKIRHALISLLKEVEESASTSPEILLEVESVKFPAHQININQSHIGHGDNVGGNKIESNEYVHVEGNEQEKKNAFVYYLEVFIIFLISFAICTGIGFAFGEMGIVIGAVIGLVIGIVNAGNIKRTKGML